MILTTWFFLALQERFEQEKPSSQAAYTRYLVTHLQCENKVAWTLHMLTDVCEMMLSKGDSVYGNKGCKIKQEERYLTKQLLQIKPGNLPT